MNRHELHNLKLYTYSFDAVFLAALQHEHFGREKVFEVQLFYALSQRHLPGLC